MLLGILEDDLRDSRYRRLSLLNPSACSSPKSEVRVSRSLDMRSSNHSSNGLNGLRVVSKAHPALLRILIVDDSSSILKVVCQMLKQRGIYPLLLLSHLILSYLILCISTFYTSCAILIYSFQICSVHCDLLFV